MYSDMYKGTGVGRSKAEARQKADEALKERLWKECWKDEVEVPRDAVERVVEVNGMFEVTVEI